MSIPASELQTALHEYQEWGEKLRTPREDRISQLLPDRTSEEIQEIMALCKEVEDASWEIASAVRDGGKTKEDAIRYLKERFDFMSAENISRTYSQAMYYTLK
jgi:hypothetical protein